MPEPVSVIGLGVLAGYTALQIAARANSAISPEAQQVRQTIIAVVDTTERSIVLFGEKQTAISEIWKLFKECDEPGWDGDGALPVNCLAASLAEDFVRALPDGFPMPEFAPEPDGGISLDWIESPTRLFSISFGLNNRLACAWLDGTDKGHAVASFDGESVPLLIQQGVKAIVGHGNTALRAA